MGHAGEAKSRAIFRVCEKLRAALVPMFGTAGFRSLVLRARALASVKMRWMEQLQINPDGAPDLSPEIESQLGADEAARGGRELVAQILGLLEIFIGEALTRRLVQDIWPRATLNSGESTKQKQQP